MYLLSLRIHVVYKSQNQVKNNDNEMNELIKILKYHSANEHLECVDATKNTKSQSTNTINTQLAIIMRRLTKSLTKLGVAHAFHRHL